MSSGSDGVAAGRVARALAGTACAAVGTVLAWLLVTQPAGPDRLADEVAEALGRSGVGNPVTAVLLNFRAFDTMLELVVLLAVTAALRSLARQAAPAGGIPLIPAAPVSPQLEGLVRDVVPLMMLVAGYLLWAGSYAPGGAFQAGAVLAAAAVLAYFTPPMQWRPREGAPMRAVLALGPGAFLAAAFAGYAVTGEYFAYPVRAAGAWILAVESIATLSIALMLYTVFLCVIGALDHAPAPDT